MQKLPKDPKWREANRKANQKLSKDPKWREANRKANQKLSKDPKWREAVRKRSKDPKWRVAQQEAVAKFFRTKPNNGEATVAAIILLESPALFYETMWFLPIDGLRGIPDLYNPDQKVIGEHDGGGHHIFKDRHADDAAKDAERRAAGYVVIRETDPAVLAFKYLAVCAGRTKLPA